MFPLMIQQQSVPNTECKGCREITGTDLLVDAGICLVAMIFMVAFILILDRIGKRRDGK